MRQMTIEIGIHPKMKKIEYRYPVADGAVAAKGECTSSLGFGPRDERDQIKANAHISDEVVSSIIGAQGFKNHISSPGPS